MLFRNSLLIASTFALLSAVVGCAESDSRAPGKTAPPAVAVTLTNAVCPIMGGAAKEDITAEWNGKTVGFCCPECIPEWNSLIDEEKAAKLAAAVEEAKEDHHHDSTQDGPENDEPNHEAH